MERVRAKFTVCTVTRVNWSPTARKIQLQPICDTTTPENERFTKFTPAGDIWLQVDNPPAADFLELGKTFYVDFTPAE
jgi:hypothetical protein